MNRTSRHMTASIIAMTLCSASAAFGQGGPIGHVLCASPAEMRERLEVRYGATRSWSGLRAPDQVMELWEDDHGEWTMIVQYAGGNWCIVAMGDAISPFADQPHG